VIDIFLKRKRDILSKKDKSYKGFWDKHISKLCDRINLSNNYYTTSSCSGRVVLMIDQEKKGRDLFKKVYHEFISFEELKKDLNCILNECKNKKIKFKLESCALHVACRTFEDAQELYNKAKLSGWKKSGIISSGSRFMVELTNTDKLEFPIIRKGKLLVDDEFLKVIVDEANKKLKKGWNRIKKFERVI